MKDFDRYHAAKLNLQELSRRLKNYRIDCEITQKELAEQCGVSLRTIQLFEAGNDIKVTNLINILSALDLTKNLYYLVPDVTIRPSAMVQPKPKQRVRKKYTPQKDDNWKWGDDK